MSITKFSTEIGNSSLPVFEFTLDEEFEEVVEDTTDAGNGIVSAKSSATNGELIDLNDFSGDYKKRYTNGDNALVCELVTRVQVLEDYIERFYPRLSLLHPMYRSSLYYISYQTTLGDEAADRVKRTKQPRNSWVEVRNSNTEERKRRLQVSCCTVIAMYYSIAVFSAPSA